MAAREELLDLEKPTYEEYLGPQCTQCGEESYDMKLVCSVCDELLCRMYRCLEPHTARHQRN